MAFEQEELAAMAPEILAMMQTPGWTLYARVVADKIATTQEVAIADDPARLLYHRGSIDGLRAAVLTGNDILNVAKDVTGERKEARRRMADAGLSTL